MNVTKENYPKTYEYICNHLPKYDTIRCGRCGSPVLTSDVEGYSYQCMYCDEDLFKTEIYEGVSWTDEEKRILSKDCVELLLLDEED